MENLNAHIPIEEVPSRQENHPVPTTIKSPTLQVNPHQTPQRPSTKINTLPKPSKANSSKESIHLKLHTKLLVTTYGIAKLNNTSVERYIQQAIKKENERQLKNAQG